MAQRNSPSRRIPGEPLAGILRTVAYQARYSNRRRADVATVTNSAATAESAQAAAESLSATLLAGSAASPDALAPTATQSDQPLNGPATFVAAGSEGVAQPWQDAATLVADENGSATLQYEDRGSVPHVVATAVADQPAVATVGSRTATAATVHVWDLTGQPVAGAFVSVVAHWP